MIHYIALAIALAISSVAAYFSIIGLVAIFPASFWPIVVMGSALEIGKIVTVSWLYRNWRGAPLLLRAPLSAMVLALMLITSLGTFGLLSKAHIDQSVTINESAGIEIDSLTVQIAQAKRSIADADVRVSQIDDALRDMIKRHRTKTSLREQRRQSARREEIIKDRAKAADDLARLTLELSKRRAAKKRAEADVGPLKYAASLVYDDPSPEQLDRSVRWIIIVLVMVFDPLAILLLMAANHGMMQNRLTGLANDDTISVQRKHLGVID